MEVTNLHDQLLVGEHVIHPQRETDIQTIIGLIVGKGRQTILSTGTIAYEPSQYQKVFCFAFPRRNLRCEIGSS